MDSQQINQSPQLYTELHDLEYVVPPTMTPSLCSCVLQRVLKTLHWIVAIGLFLWMDSFWKKVFAFGSTELLAELMGMACILIILIILYFASPTAASIFAFLFEPGVMFIHKWLPLFYAPYLVMLPLSIKDIPLSSGIKTYLILVGGCVATLCVIGYTAILISKYVKTSLQHYEHMENPSTFSAEPIGRPSKFSSIGVWAWTVIFLISFVASLFYPTALGTKARTCLPFLLASAVLGHMVGSTLPSKVKKVYHSTFFSALCTILTSYAFGCFTQSGLDPVLGYFVTTSSSNPGAGDILMGFLGSAILSFPFCISQRKLVERHSAEILTSIIVSPILLMATTILIGPLLILEPSLTDSILLKCITVALALIIVSIFKGANSSVATAAVVVCGVIGVNFVQSTFPDAIGGIPPAYSDPGIGIAPSPAKEPKVFTIIAHVLNGLFF